MWVKNRSPGVSGAHFAQDDEILKDMDDKSVHSLAQHGSNSLKKKKMANPLSTQESTTNLGMQNISLQHFIPIKMVSHWAWFMGFATAHSRFGASMAIAWQSLGRFFGLKRWSR